MPPLPPPLPNDQHTPVLAEPFVAALTHRVDGVVVDGTFGRGGHSRMVLERLSPAGHLVALDRDPYAVVCGEELQQRDQRFTIVRSEFSQLASVLVQLGIASVDAIGFDFGLSSPQLDRAERGFSFAAAGPLDMRMNPDVGTSLASMLGSVSHYRLTQIIRDYGEERFAGRVARAIIGARDEGGLATTRDLAQVITSALPAKSRYGRTHPATRTFQALRIWVNDEYREIEDGLVAAIRLLKPGGVLAAISFHSGEDSRVKEIVESHVNPCICPPQLPVCGCGRVADMRWVQKRPLRAPREELERNTRARSARLRIAVKCGEE
ncbi:MAG: 16S rRNA (cytosine(1402)-N(4))-methyltransferase RsmH [Mariprofundales bacterium]|nr:16S rRNA (cytosine(1402)-N(4))-methyltransferase RsmH [Mariprofundales bacterium]